MCISCYIWRTLPNDMRRIIGIGETVLDIIFKNDRVLTAVPGGSTFNSLISLGRTAGRDFPGVRILMVTETGGDHVGDIICGFMRENGVETEAVTRNRGTQSHISLAFLNEKNDAQYEFYKDHAHASLNAENVSGLEFRSDDIVLFGSYFAINPVIRSFTGGLLKAAHRAGAIIYYDINFRRNHLADLDQTIGNIRENCCLSDFVRGSSEDFDILTGGTAEDIYAKYVSPLCANLIYTRGAEPTEVFSEGFRAQYATRQIQTVSTIGAGDNFNAGFIYAIIAEGIRKEDCRHLTPAQWERLVRTASLFSAEVCRSTENYVGTAFEISL